MCQAFLAETVETGTKNCWVIEATHVLRRKLRKDFKFRAFPKRVGPRILSLESVDYFGTSEHYWAVEKKRRILISKTSMVGCWKLSFYANESCDEHGIYFWRWLKWRALKITFLISGNYVISLESRPSEFSCIYTRVYPSTADVFLVVANTRTQFRNKKVSTSIMHQSIPAALSSLPRPAGWPPCISIFFALDGKFPEVGTLELSNPRPPSTLQHFSLIA